jgi:hypothetical protein
VDRSCSAETVGKNVAGCEHLIALSRLYVNRQQPAANRQEPTASSQRPTASAYCPVVNFNVHGWSGCPSMAVMPAVNSITTT